MTLSAAFSRHLAATGYLAGGAPAYGVHLRSDGQSHRATSRFDFMFDRRRFPLRVDALFRTGGSPTIVFLDSTVEEPGKDDLLRWHGLSWNFGLAPLLWVSTPTRIVLLNSYAPPRADLAGVQLSEFDLKGEKGFVDAAKTCGRLAFDTGSFWRSERAARISRRERVDAVLLRELAALESLLFADGLERLLAQKLIGRMIFLQYLVDRNLLKSDDLTRLFGSGHLPDLLRDTRAADGLFAWLRRTFNGDLFPPDISGEGEIVRHVHLRRLADFLKGLEVSTGQWRMFPFRFDVIPVELISSIYEQFAHSAAGDEAVAQGLHYTPINLVDLTLDAAFADVDPYARVLDPACGSGAFLVEAMRRLVFLRSQTEPCTRTVVRDVLHRQIHGVDINPGALQVTAFSLYLAALELDPELPGCELEWLRFDHLIGRTLRQGSFFEQTLDANRFEVVVGNPPWTYRSGERGARRSAPTRQEVAQPRRSPDWAFLWRARSMAVPGARISLLMKATPFFSKERGASESRGLLLSSFEDVTIINLSQLRGENLFPAVQVSSENSKAKAKANTGPAVLFSGRVGVVSEESKVELVNVPWTSGFRDHGMLDIPPESHKRIPISVLKSDGTLFKAAMFGNAREFALMKDLLSAGHLVQLGSWCRSNGIPMDQGLQLSGSDRNDASALKGLRLIDARSYRPGRVSTRLPILDVQHAHRPRDRAIYNGALVLCPESGFAKALQKGRYSAALSTNDIAFTDSFVGVSLYGRDPRLAASLCAILNSKVIAFQLALGASNIGLKQPKVEKIDLEALVIPDLFKIQDKKLERAAQIGTQLGQGTTATTLDGLDDLVMDLYGLPSYDRRIIHDAFFRSKPLFLDTRSEKLRTVENASERELLEYGNEVTHWLDTLIRDAGSLRAVLHRGVRLSLDVVALRFDLEEGPPRPLPPFTIGEPELIEFQPLRQALGENAPSKLRGKRFARVYAERSIYVIKPLERRYWRVADAQADVQEILDDHNRWKNDVSHRFVQPNFSEHLTFHLSRH